MTPGRVAMVAQKSRRRMVEQVPARVGVAGPLSVSMLEPVVLRPQVAQAESQ